MVRLKNTIKTVLFTAGFYDFYGYLKGARSPRLLVLMYHDLRVNDNRRQDSDEWEGAPTQDEFAAHMRAIKRKYRVMTLAAATAELATERRFRKPTVAVTFDDGYASMYELAWPVLRDLGLTATVFPITGWVNGSMRLWWEQLYILIDQAKLTEAELGRISDLFGFDAGKELQSAASPELQRSLLARRLEVRLRFMSHEACLARMKQLETLLADDPARLAEREPKPMTWERIRELADAGIEIGAHSITHSNLNYAPPEQVTREAVESRSELERRLSREIVGFCCPYGDTTNYRQVMPLIAQAGYRYCCPGLLGYNAATANPLAIRRTTLPLTTSEAVLGRCLKLDYIGDARTQAIGREYEQSRAH